MKPSQKTSILFIETAAGRRPLTDLEKCLLLILKTESNISSQRVLELAKKFPLCSSCSDRSEVIAIGEKLLKKGLIERKLNIQEYIWSLTKKGVLFAKQI